MLALDCYSRALLADPRSARALSNRALVFLELRKPLHAWGDAKVVLEELDPSHANARIRLGMAYQSMQCFGDAIRTYRECLLQEGLHDETRGLLERRLSACMAAAEKQSAPSAVGGMTAGDMHSLGYAPLLYTFRAGKGGPRVPATVADALGANIKPGTAVLRPMPDGHGVGMFARASLPSGSLVQLEEPLLASTISSSNCYHCTRLLTASAVPCRGGACGCRFCSAACERTALNQYHKPLCAMADGKAVARLTEYAMKGVSSSSRFILLAWKLLGWAMQSAAVKRSALVPPADIPPFCHLPRRNDAISEDAARAFNEMAHPSSVGARPLMEVWSLMRSLMTPELRTHPALSIGWLYDVYMLLGPNATALSTASAPRWIDGAMALMSAGNCFNHSCVANVSRTSESDEFGPVQAFVTNKAVKAGEQLFISYWEADASYEERRNRLEFQYGFKCSCAKCTEEEKTCRVPRLAGVTILWM